jgi:hypothetical protein
LTKEQLNKQLKLLHKDLTKVELRMEKISDKLGIHRGHEYVERTLWEIETLLKMFNDDASKETPTS